MNWKRQRYRVRGLVAAALCLCPLLALGSPASALREYKGGQYDKAYEEYQNLLKRKGDDPRLHFNAGAAAYRNGQYDESVKQFDQALASPDLKLQQSAYYNRGNAFFRAGERANDPKQRTASWEKSIKDYDLSLGLNSQDADAKFNREFVKRKLEELKQQQQQEQQDKSDQQKQDQQQPQQNQQNQEQKQNQDQQQAQQNQPDQKNQSSQQQQQQQQAQQDQQQQQQKQTAEQKQQDQQQASQAAGQQTPQDKQREDAQAYAKGEMTPEQARQLLDAEKGDEKMLPVKPEGKPRDSSRPFKDW